ncbi:FAD-dependent monooxygenase [Streptomyces sp. IMTB 2501]|uniref:FAD-dependent monooxygenase n=1 Tax=Streptomyces sp. IMTB 2501 TaxID=1776340 RepID=UPI001C4B13FD|nr:FAD-dependent monooxygenase [Streptomyces sp. IMTB 2501]
MQVPQVEVERILGQRAAELSLKVRHGVGVRGYNAQSDGVTVRLEAGATCA